MPNTQPPEPRDKNDDGRSLDVHSVFFTIQGEGPLAGNRAIFVRLAGCNLQCPGCDTEYTEGRERWITRHLATYVEAIAHENKAAGCLVVVTGGEPLRQHIGPFLSELVLRGHFIQVETNGVFAPDFTTQFLASVGDVMLVVSPKTSRIHGDSARLAHAFKYVLDADSVNPADGLPVRALEHPASTGVARPPTGTPIFINPFDTGDEARNKRNLQAAADSCKRFGYTLGVQIHKLVGLA